MRRGLAFAKGHGLGNDYLVLDAAEAEKVYLPGLARAACDRHTGAGADGILVGDPDTEPVRLRIFNPDGSEAEKSGNGLRIFAAYLHRRGRVGTEPFVVALTRDAVTMRVHGDAPGGGLDISAAMGRAVFLGEAVGFQGEPTRVEVLDRELDLGDGLRARIHTVSLGNPHCVVFVEALEREDFLMRAPRLGRHPAFANGTNVQFARVAGEDRLELWIHERGAGETLASGSSACAAAAAAVRTGRIRPGRITVGMQGGDAAVEVDENYEVRLRAPARIVYEGVFTPETIAVWTAATPDPRG